MGSKPTKAESNAIVEFPLVKRFQFIVLAEFEKLRASIMGSKPTKAESDSIVDSRKEISQDRKTHTLNLLNSMRKAQELTDTVLVCKQMEFHVHRVILSVASNYFKNMLQKSIGKRVDFSFIERDTMETYVPCQDVLENKTYDQLLEIHKISHLFGLTDLSELCWELIVKDMTATNFLNVWMTHINYGDKEESEDILNFMSNNLKAVVEENNFLELGEKMIKKFFEQINETNIPTEDYLLDALLKWIKFRDDRQPLLNELFLQLNFELVSKEFINTMLSSELSLHWNNLLIMFIEHQLKPKLKSKAEIDEILKNTSSYVKANNKQSILKLLSFGYYLQNTDESVHFKNVLQTIDILNNQIISNVISLPFEILDMLGCFLHGSIFYFVNQTASGAPKIISYDWKSNSEIQTLSLPQQIQYVHGSVTEDALHVAGEIKVESVTRSSILRYSMKNNAWSIFNIPTYSYHIITCASLQKQLYVLCKLHKKNEYRFFKLAGFDNSFKETKKFSLTNTFQCQFFTTYKDKLYAVDATSNRCRFFFYDPISDSHQIFDVTFSDWEPMKECSGTDEDGIFLLGIRENLFRLDPEKKEIKKLPLNIHHLRQNGKFFRIKYNKSNEFFIASSSQ